MPCFTPHPIQLRHPTLVTSHHAKAPYVLGQNDNISILVEPSMRSMTPGIRYLRPVLVLSDSMNLATTIMYMRAKSHAASSCRGLWNAMLEMLV